jgi:hypothetical protein
MKRLHVLLLLSWFGALPACSTSDKSGSPGATQGAVTAHEEHPPALAPGQVVTVEPPAGAKVFFVSPSDGAEVKGALTDGKVKVPVKMGVANIVVQPAGEVVKGTGHHHIIVDGAGIPLGTVVPKDETHLHYGKGQTEAELVLPPGEHSLTLQFADGIHLSYGPALSSTIKIKVAAAP